MKMKHISKIIAIIGLLLVGMPKANAQVTVDAKIAMILLICFIFINFVSQID